MENGPLHDDKLFRAVNDRLSNYEAPYEGADWDAMSRSLDQLPKATRYTFQWKISLNTILIAIGVLSVSILGYAFSGGNNGKDTNTASADIPAVQVNNNNNDKPSTPVQNVVLQTNATNTASVTDNNTSVHHDANAAMMPVTNAANGSFHRRKTDADNNGLYFGDMIDRRKGFIYHTQESSTLVSSHTDSIPSTYYDIVDGRQRTIHIDSTPHHNKPKSAVDSVTTTASGTPSEGTRTGFNMQ